MICPICIIYLKCCHIGGGAVWNIKSSTWLCVLSSWKSVSREIAHPRPPCTLRVLAWASPVPPPPPEKERRGRLRRPTRPQHRRRRLRLNCAHGSRRRSRRRARCAPPLAGGLPLPLSPLPPPPLRTRVPEAGPAAVAAAGSAAAGRGLKGWVEGCATAAAHFERTAPPPPTLPERGGGIQGRRSRRGQSLHSLGVPPSFEQWEVRAVLYLSRHARATEMWPARAENRARVNTRSRTASFARRAVHHFLAARIVQREES